jgi:tetratricopeptide (TPR) repeat protein
MNQDNVVLCYEAIQRVYRNAMVGLIRERLTAAFPTDAFAKLRAPFEKEWSTMEQNAQASRITGELTTSIADNYDLLSVNHFFNLFDTYYDLLAEPDPALKETDKKKQKQTLLNWLKTIKSLRDPLSHPTEADFSFEDSYPLLDCVRRVLLQLRLAEPATSIKQITERLLANHTSTLTTREPLEDRLPPRESIVFEFIGRDRELKELRDWFSDPASRRWALAGEGGKGKSSLAYCFALEIKLSAPQPYQTVLWLSAKKKQFVEGITVEISKPDFYDLDSALAALLTHYGWLDEITFPVDSKRKRVLELLSEFPALVVIDDVDSLDSQNENVIEFFSLDVPATRSKVLFTSRRTIFGLGGTTTHVTGFSDEDAGKFILSRCELMELDPTPYDKHLIKRIVKTTEGSPLYIEELMRLTATIHSVNETIKQWEERGGREARKYALGRECELLSTDARNVLFAACICSGAVSFSEIEAVTGFAPQLVTTALQELQKLFLVPKPRLIEGEQRFEVNINTRALVRDVYGTSDQYRRMVQAYKTISKGVRHDGAGELGAIIRQAMFFLRAGRHEDAENLLLKASERYQSNPSLMGILGLVYKAWSPPRLTDAREKFRRAWQLKCARLDTYDHWCKMETREREWSKVIDAADKGLQILPQDRLLLYWKGYGCSRLGKDLQAGLEWERAKEELTRARLYLEESLKLSDTEPYAGMFDAAVLRALVITCELLDDLGSMQHYFRRWLNKFPDDPDAISEWKRVSHRYNIQKL